jgi:predicted dehydrogenase
MKRDLGDGPMAMTYRINAGVIPADSWIQDRERGGGRIIGEVCHFVDFLTYINGSLPVSVYAVSMADPQDLEDIVNISLGFRNGAIGTISYFSNGDKGLSKERVEVFANGNTVVLDDFKILSIYSGGTKRGKKLLSQDKGQKNEVKSFIEAVRNGRDNVIPFEELCNTCLVTFRVLESLRTGKAVTV